MTPLPNDSNGGDLILQLFKSMGHWCFCALLSDSRPFSMPPTPSSLNSGPEPSLPDFCFLNSACQWPLPHASCSPAPQPSALLSPPVLELLSGQHTDQPGGYWVASWGKEAQRGDSGGPPSCWHLQWRLRTWGISAPTSGLLPTPAETASWAGRQFQVCLPPPAPGRAVAVAASSSSVPSLRPCRPGPSTDSQGEEKPSQKGAPGVLAGESMSSGACALVPLRKGRRPDCPQAGRPQLRALLRK